jgi:nitrogen fixation/metabolism regulation signal transduction histidine kinase
VKWFFNLATRGKLYLGFGLMTGFLLTVIVVAYSAIADIRSTRDKLYRSEFANATDVLLLRNHQNGARAAVLNLILHVGRPADRERWIQEIRERSGEISLITQRLLERNRHNPGLLEKIKELSAVREALVKTREEEIMPLIHAGELERAKSFVVGIQEERFRKIRDLGRELDELVQQEARTSVAQSERKVEQTLRVFFAVGLVAVLSGLALVFLLDRVIAVPLRAVAEVAGRVAAGDLTTRLAAERALKLGELIARLPPDRAPARERR